MSDIVRQIAMAIWEKRRECAKRYHDIELEEWGDGSIPMANHVLEEAQAALDRFNQITPNQAGS